MENFSNFGDLPPEYSSKDNSKIVVIPAPYDGTSTWIKGSDKGPRAIIEASANMELYDIETDSQVYINGIFTSNYLQSDSSPEDFVNIIKRETEKQLNSNKFCVLIGGEHSVSIGSMQAHAKHYDDICILQFDAHADLRDEYEGSKFNHACVMARAKELCPIVQVGIRSMDSSEKESMNVENVFFAKDIIHNVNIVNDKLIPLLSDNVYISFDLDVFDPSIMPSTGTPEPGGLLWYDVLSILKIVCENKNVVGFDVVELCPIKNICSPNFLAAKLIYKLLSYKFK